MIFEPSHILLIRLSSVGDVILATPAAAQLRSWYPKARLTWLVDDGYQDLLRGNPHVDEVVIFEAARRHHGPGGIRLLAEQLEPVDLLVDLQHKVRTVLLSWYLHPTERWVWAKRSGSDIMRAIVGRDPILQGPHQIERYLRLLVQSSDQSKLDGEMKVKPQPLLRPDEENRRQALVLLKCQEGGAKVIGAVIGTRHRSKRWPPQHWHRLCQSFLDQGYRVLLLGGTEDKQLVEAVAAGLQSESVLCHTGGSLGVLAALLSLCQAVVSSDSGPAHMAAAIGVPVVTLFGPTSPARWAPVSPNSRVVSLHLACSPCSNHGGSSCRLGTLECMEQLKPELVWSEVRSLLQPGC